MYGTPVTTTTNNNNNNNTNNAFSSLAQAVFTELMLKVSGPTNDDQKELVISRLLGDDVFYDLKADELKDLMERECWKADKMEEWKKENGLSDKKED